MAANLTAQIVDDYRCTIDTDQDEIQSLSHVQ